MDFDKQLEAASAAIVAQPQNALLYIQRGKLHHRAGAFGPALNDFMKALQLDPNSNEAREFITMINNILEFRHTDQLNP